MPGVDTEALLESHDRNIEALTRATEVATEGAAAVYRRQQEIMQAAGEQVSAMVRDIKLGTEQQAEVAKKVFERALADARELAEMSAKANQDAHEVMKKASADEHRGNEGRVCQAAGLELERRARTTGRSGGHHAAVLASVLSIRSSSTRVTDILDEEVDFGRLRVETLRSGWSGATF